VSDVPDEPELPLPDEAPKKKLSLDFDPAVVGYPAAGERKAAAKPKRDIKWGKILGTIAIGALSLVVIVGAISVLTLPGCLKRKCIEAAASRGVVLTIDDVHLGAGRFTLVNVGAAAAELPGMSVKSAEVEVEMAGFEPSLVTARKAEIVIDGSYETVKESIAKWRAAHKATAVGGGAGAGSGAQARIVLDGAHVAWSKPFGAHVKLDVLEMHAELGTKGAVDEVHVLSPHVLLDVDGGKVGPWRVSHDREGADARSRISFDPQLPDGPSAIFVMTAGHIASIDVTIPRAALTNVGLSPELFGLPQGSSTQLEANIHFSNAVANRADAQAKLGLYAIKLAAVPTPLDAKLEVQFAGDANTGAEVKKGTLAVGPLSGSVVGTLKLFDDGMRIDLGWKAGPLPCTAFALGTPPTPGAPTGLGDLGAHLAQLAHATGIAKVTGDIRMEGTLTFDSRDFDHAKVAFTPTSTCDVALFGGN
jgi:hypothetical protein